MMRSTLAEKQGNSWTGVRYRIQSQLMSDLGRGQLTSTRRQSKQPRAALPQPAAPGHHRELSSAKPPSVLAIPRDGCRGRLWIWLSEGTHWEGRHGNRREDGRRGKGPAKSFRSSPNPSREASRRPPVAGGGTREAHWRASVTDQRAGRSAEPGANLICAGAGAGAGGRLGPGKRIEEGGNEPFSV
jgi:hypothetical protein